MNRQELITDFTEWLKDHAEEVKSHICQPPYDFMDDEDWEEVQKGDNE